MALSPLAVNRHARTDRFSVFGDGFIAGDGDGILTKAGVFAHEEIILFLKDPGIPIVMVSRQRSKADGTYKFEQLDQTRKYCLIAFDGGGNFNAVIRDNITPEPMP